MIIKKVIARIVRNSRKENTIQVIIKTSKGKFKTSAPSGKSKGKYEVRPYVKSLEEDINFINNLDLSKLEIKKFDDLNNIEKLVKNKIGANSLFVLEASLLKALAKENKKELWNFLRKSNKFILPRPIGNAIGGGLHSKGKKPDFQEFLFISKGKTFKECVKLNKVAYKLFKKLSKTKKRNDEGAWETSLSGEKVLDVMKKIKTRIKNKYGKEIAVGLDIAASSFYKNGEYVYKNFSKKLNKAEQIEYIEELIKLNNIFYVEDPLNENDFSGFKELLRRIKKNKCLIVGDDLTTTNTKRLKKAIRLKSINAIIVKPNQTGSLLKVKEVIKIAKKYGVVTIISHRSGETRDDTIADLGVGFGCNFIKTGIYGKVRESKLNRLIKIEKRMKKVK